MAITSVGYPGQIDSVEWARVARGLGHDYAVLGQTDFQVSIVAGQDRTLSVAPAVAGAFGRGIWDVSDAAETVQLPVLASGTRWDLICLRRTWGTTNATTVAYVEGTSTMQVPATRNANPGVLDDQPLALVRITAGQQTPSALIDLRARAHKVLMVDDLMAVVDPQPGMHVRVGTREYYRGLSSGSPSWLLASNRQSKKTNLPAGSWSGTNNYNLGTVSITLTEQARVSVGTNGFYHVAGTGQIRHRIRVGSALVASQGAPVVARADGQLAGLDLAAHYDEVLEAGTYVFTCNLELVGSVTATGYSDWHHYIKAVSSS